jgi:hypothetical protein
MRLFALAFAAILLSVLSLRAEPVSVDAIAVVDGDTIDVGPTCYRMIGYDTPEIKTPRRKVSADEKALATIAKERFIELLHSGPLDLTEVRCSCPADTIGTKLQWRPEMWNPDSQRQEHRRYADRRRAGRSLCVPRDELPAHAEVDENNRVTISVAEA